MIDGQTDTIYTAFVTFICGGSFVAVTNAWTNRKKTAAETNVLKANVDETIVGSAMEFVKAIREEAVDLRKRAAEQERRADVLEKKIDLLEQHIHVQIQIINSLREALAVYNPEHPLLLQQPPQHPL